MKETAVRKEIARRLRAAVQAAGATQAEMARRLAIRQPTFNRYLRGERVMPEADVSRLAEATGFEVEVLLFGRGSGDHLRRLESYMEKPQRPGELISFRAAPIPPAPPDWPKLTQEERATINHLTRLLVRARGGPDANNDAPEESTDRGEDLSS